MYRIYIRQSWDNGIWQVWRERGYLFKYSAEAKVHRLTQEVWWSDKTEYIVSRKPPT